MVVTAALAVRAWKSQPAWQETNACMQREVQKAGLVASGREEDEEGGLLQLLWWRLPKP